MHPGQQRIRYLDGLRGIAVSLVVGWHFLGIWFEGHGPYSDKRFVIPFVAHGWIGVYLFFIISGFVIFMSLERCRSFADFMGRRWLRLFPLMFAASAIIFAQSHVIGALTGKEPKPWWDILPGLTFISPSIYHALFHIDFDSLDGVFWTLYVEFFFYMFFGAAFFILGRRRAIVAVGTLWVVSLVLPNLLSPFAGTPLFRATEPFGWLGVPHLGWFLSGILFARFVETRSRPFLLAAIAIGLLNAWVFKGGLPMNAESRLMLMLVTPFFASAVLFDRVQTMLNWPPLLFLGSVSYALYLIHSGFGISLAELLIPLFSPAASAPIALAALTLTVLLSFALTRFAERPIKDVLRNGMKGLSGQLLRKQRGASP
jgi:peptidoglycan/LPS O-acetylase OafA/YrhL